MPIHVFKKDHTLQELTWEELQQQKTDFLRQVDSLCIHAKTVEQAVKLLHYWVASQSPLSLFASCLTNAAAGGISFGFNAPPLGPGPGMFMVFYYPDATRPIPPPTVAVYSLGLGHGLVAWLDRLVGKEVPIYQYMPKIHIVPSGYGSDQLLAYLRLRADPRFVLTAPHPIAEQHLTRRHIIK